MPRVVSVPPTPKSVVPSSTASHDCVPETMTGPVGLAGDVSCASVGIPLSARHTTMAALRPTACA